ncbi:TlpA disulfide reductase family protein [Lutibacter sp.]|uniref:TlpA family protein disulfide reductase n=1 Tax=Lutibacter sp. TaxID=1925666 RepID=UPI002735BED6|nr:TlpA disulfide reductase family protein [Lutibacter sp.]MDP3312249.1 TlpA disulfide reductase family protein [Lutibacter sp.]
MKKLIWLFAVIIITISCKEEVKDYVTLNGILKNANSTKITVQGRGFSKEINVNEDGTFTDTLRVTDGVHALTFENGDRITLFLKNGFDLNLQFKGDNIVDGIVFTGIGAETNNFMENKKSFFMSDFANPKTYFSLDKKAYETRLAEAKKTLKGFKDNAKDLDSLIDAMDSKNDEMFFGYIESNYEAMNANMMKLATGKLSPTFANYENFKGGKTSLTDLKGKYVYIDVWATWCAPCKAEIPFLKTLEEEYKGKNIAFVSVSVDEANAHSDWKKMVKDLNLGGVQLFADKSFESEFILEYGITAIPRFILIDPKGVIVDSDAKRPSDPTLKDQFKSLGI